MSAGMNTQPYRILVIDDNPAIHADFRKVLFTDDVASSKGEINDLEAELFGGTVADGGPTFDIDSAMQGEEGLEKLKDALAECGNVEVEVFAEGINDANLEAAIRNNCAWS